MTNNSDVAVGDKTAMKKFQEQLAHNQMEMAKKAMLQTLTMDPDMKIRDILEGLENDEDDIAQGMAPIFAELTIREIIGAFNVQLKPKSEDVVEEVLHASQASQASVAKTQIVTDDDDVENDDEFAMDDELSFDEEEEVLVASSEESFEEDSSKEEIVDTSTPEGKKAYKANVLKALKKLKASDEESAVTSNNLQGIVGGDSKQRRDILNSLIDEGKVSFHGKARGTKYYLVS